jgi:putative membrane protein
LILNNEFAKKRTHDAADRAFMAWTRTAVSMIGFGFAIAQAYQL